MKLEKLIKVLPKVELYNKNNHHFDYEVSGICLDSRAVKPGDLFIAYPGEAIDSRDFIADSIKNGANVIIYDSNNFKLDSECLNNNTNTVLLAYPNIRNFVGKIISLFYGCPSSTMQIFAVTGTNGKTTCTYLLAQLLSELNNKENTGVIGTVGYGEIKTIINDNCLSKLENTTPSPLVINKILSEFKALSIQNVCMEASSHALEQSRLNGIDIDTAIFTNLSHDHLDYHKTIEDYFNAKKKLFFLDSIQNIVINIDDPYGEKLLNEILDDEDILKNKKVMLYGFDISKLNKYQFPYVLYHANKYYIAKSGAVNIDEAVEFNFKTDLIGSFNKYNLLACISALLINNYSVEDILTKISSIKSAPGRMEVYNSKSNDIDLIVDYAHTPDALKKALEALNEQRDFSKLKYNIWCIFGCGGDRDKSKRAEMGQIATEHADKIIITNDNPRTEAPDDIINDIKLGIFNDKQGKIFAIINDRKQAIITALNNAKPNDKILIAGKGHEDYQIIGTKKINYNEREFVAGLIKND